MLVTSTAKCGIITSMNVLLIGKRARILDDVAGYLRAMHHDVTLTNNLDMQWLRSIDVRMFSAVAFGRALSAEQKSELTEHYLQQNPLLVFVEGWAPIPELIAYQVLAAGSPISGLNIDGSTLRTEDHRELRVKGYRLSWLYRLKVSEAKIALEPGVSVDITQVMRGFKFFALKDADTYCVLKLDS